MTLEERLEILNRPHRAGYAAHQRGDTRNPYPVTSPEYGEWIDGWHAAEEDCSRVSH